MKLNGTVDDAADTPAISGDGRYVAFVTDSTGLVTGGNSNFYQVYVRDRTAGDDRPHLDEAERLQGTDDSGHPSLSSDGRYLAFESDSPGLVTGDTNDWTDVFVRDRVANTTEAREPHERRARKPTSGARARRSAVTAATSRSQTYEPMTADDTNGIMDVYVRDTVANTTTLVSRPAGGGTSNGNSFSPVISADGEERGVPDRGDEPGRHHGHQRQRRRVRPLADGQHHDAGQPQRERWAGARRRHRSRRSPATGASLPTNRPRPTRSPTTPTAWRTRSSSTGAPRRRPG